jgi:hypothetical protein
MWMAKHRQLIVRTLQIDPDHLRAGAVATAEYNMVCYQGRWMTQDERKKIMDEENAAKLATAQNLRERLEALSKERDTATADRYQRLAVYHSALRSAERPEQTESVLRSLGQAVAASPDPGFCFQGVELLENFGSSAAISPLQTATSCRNYAEVRLDACRALLCRPEPEAYAACAEALRAEVRRADRDLVLRSVLELLTRRGDKPAYALLHSLLQNAERELADEIVQALASQHGRQEDRASWLRWLAQQQ